MDRETPSITIVSDEEGPPTLPSTPRRGTKRRALTHSTIDSRPSKRHRRSAIKYFILPENHNEIKESLVNNNLTQEEADSNSLSPDGPLRALATFTFFDAATLAYIGLESLGNDGVKIQGHGAVRSLVHDDDEDEIEEEDGTRLRYQHILLDEIQEWWIGNGVDDAEMYIKTPHAWYLLEDPDDEYQTVFADFWIPHRLSQLITDTASRFHSGEIPNVNLDRFVGSLAMFRQAEHTIGRPIVQADVFASLDVIRDDLAHYDAQTIRKLQSCDLVREIITELHRTLPQHPVNETNRSQAGPPREFDSGQETVVTPLIFKIASKYFRNLQVIGDLQETYSEPPPRQPRQSEACIRLSDELKKIFPDEDEYVLRINFEEKYYQVGDFVAVKPGEEDRLFLPKHDTSNALAKEFWFGQIKRIYTRKNRKDEKYQEIRSYAHIQWYQHSSATDLQELGAPNELFRTNDCDDIGLATIKQLIKVMFIKGTQDPPNYLIDDLFFCRYSWDCNNGSFLALDQHPYQQNSDVVIDPLPPGLACDACDSTKYMEYKADGLVFPADDKATPTTIVYCGKKFHLLDTVLFIPSQEENGLELNGKVSQLAVGVIESFRMAATSTRPHHVLLRLLRPMDSLLSSRHHATEILPQKPTRPMDERRLYRTMETIQLPVRSIVRHCIVKCQLNWRPHSDLQSDAFFLTHQAKKVGPTLKDLELIHPSRFQQCKKCEELENDRTEVLSLFKRHGKQYKTMDICSGAGGLSAGLENGGLFKPKWAIEIDIFSARTYKKNHPTAQVFNQDANVCAMDALQQHLLAERPPRITSLDPEASPLDTPRHMPKKGSVDAIIAGPPCPDFSLQNIHRNSKKEGKTGLVLVTLSMIDIYRPKVFLLENVAGMLSYACRDRRTGEIVKFGIVKVLLSSLTRMGYSVRWGLFNAANYGTPQFRPRIVFYGVKIGFQMPLIPIPSHITLKDARVSYTRENGRLTRLTSPLAPHPPVSLVAAIGDLPAFEWNVENPVTPIHASRGIPQFLGESKNGKESAGFKKARPYDREATSLFQARMRVRREKKVKLQVTRTFALGRSQKALRVMTVAMEANADHRSIPLRIQDWAHSDPMSAAARTLWAPGRYGRLDWQGTFETLITRVEPTAKQGKVLHPSQRRLVSVREIARGQGFPDHYEFATGTPLESTIRQIGNAVPLPLAAAFAKVFCDAAVEDWYREVLGEDAESREPE